MSLTGNSIGVKYECPSITHSIDNTRTPFSTSRSVSFGGAEKNSFVKFQAGEKARKANPIFDFESTKAQSLFSSSGSLPNKFVF